MAQQISLFGEPADEPGRARPAFDPLSLPVPPKLGPARVRFGTSSWTYPGWSGHVYRDVAAYGKSFSQRSLAEYARDPRFRTVGADNLYYVAPAQRMTMLRQFHKQLDGVPVDLCPKVWHGITVNRYTRQQQQQFRLSTELNRDFLDPQAFVAEVVDPLNEALGASLGPLILEIQENDLAPAAFAAALDRFLSQARARAAFRLVVELRTLDHFTQRYLDVLSANGAGHALNSWTRMPPIGWQLDQLQRRLPVVPGGLLLVRALLRPGRFAQTPRGAELTPGSSYAEAVEAYDPYDRIQQRLPEVRADILRTINDTPPETAVYVIVNNRLEGHAPGTIAELLRQLTGAAPEGFPSFAARGTGERDV